jgi:hypothetical protein
MSIVDCGHFFLIKQLQTGVGTTLKESKGWIKWIKCGFKEENYGEDH